VITIAALIAAFNEERHVGDVVNATRPYVSRVFVVDDGSSDETSTRARDAGAVVLRHDHNRGKGSAIRTGLTRILDEPFTHVLFIDADFQHDPAEIPTLVERARRGAGDFVLAERELKREAMPPARFYSNVIGSRVLSFLIGVGVTDSQSGFRLVRADLLRAVQLTGSKYEIETEMLIKLVRRGAVLDRVTVRRLQYEGARSKIRPFRDTFRTCMLALGYRYMSGRALDAK